MIYLSLAAAIFLLLALVAMIARSFRTDSDLDFAGQPQEGFSLDDRNSAVNDALNLEIFLKAFGDDDQRFVETLGDSRVQKLLAYERKRIALRWIGRKTAEARGIMQAHVRRAREATDLSVSAEIRLALQYVELRALFEFLALSVFIFGTAGLRKWALRTNAILLDMRRFGQSAVPGAVVP
jgi:hypothetical protein